MLMEMASATYQAVGILRHGRSTRSHTLSVTSWKYLCASTALLSLISVCPGLRRDRREIRMGVADTGQEHVARPGVELGEERIGARQALLGRHLARLVVEVAEGDGVGRTGLGAGGGDLAVPDRAVLVLRPDL